MAVDQVIHKVIISSPLPSDKQINLIVWQDIVACF